MHAIFWKFQKNYTCNETVYKILTHWIGWLGHYSGATGLLAFLGNNCRSYRPSSLFSEKLKNHMKIQQLEKELEKMIEQ